MQIRPVDVHDDEEFHAFDGGQTLVGAGVAQCPLLDNTDMIYCTVDVAPDQRRRGVGTALANWELHRVLELPVPEDTVQGWVDECAPHHEGYRIETHVGGLPDVLLPSYVQLLNQLVLDAPTGDIDFEEEAVTVEAFKERQAKLEEQGRTMYVTVATVGDGTEAVAHSVIAVPAEGADEPNLYQGATLVGRGHRGHRLGMATKARNLREVQKAHSERTMAHTSNSEVNGPMVAINERMGFRPVELNAEFQRLLV